MRQIALFLIGFLISSLTIGQTLKLQAGTSISQLDWQLKGINIEPFYPETLIGVSIFTGLDYMDKKLYNLSSNIGYIRRGGKGTITYTNDLGEPQGELIEKPTLDYISLNTTIEVKYPIKKTISPFISFGPRFDYLISASDHFNIIDEIDELKSTSIGLLLGGGLKYDFSKIQIGLRADYYLDFTKVADYTFEQTDNGAVIEVNTLTINLSIGYKLKLITNANPL